MSPASLPANTRIYAVGDIHGRADLLSETIARIEEDLRRRPIQHAREVYLGDYVDRGPDSKGVIDQLAVRLVQRSAACLRGNHEALFETFLRDDPSTIHRWTQLGALHTFASYGVSVRSGTATRSPLELQKSLRQALPHTHDLFLQCLSSSFSCGDFLFVHAGIRPGIPIMEQNSEDLLWIREEFLNSTIDHGKVIVHGHTPVDHPDIRDNRINIDTGAWFSGTLTCIAIEGSTVLVL
jgi:serine/threonine protein phosphatase 1